MAIVSRQHALTYCAQSRACNRTGTSCRQKGDIRSWIANHKFSARATLAAAAQRPLVVYVTGVGVVYPAAVAAGRRRQHRHRVVAGGACWRQQYPTVRRSPAGLQGRSLSDVSWLERAHIKICSAAVKTSELGCARTPTITSSRAQGPKRCR